MIASHRLHLDGLPHPPAGAPPPRLLHRDLDGWRPALRESPARRRRDLRGEAVAGRLAAAVQFRDGETGAHLARVGLYAEALARRLGWFDEAALRDLRVAAAVHDVGKLGVPDRVLLKPGALTREESVVMQRHAEIGAAIIGDSDLPVLRLGRQIALHHHERWDGGGYPRGLAGDAIPAVARIVAVADVYDSLVHNRVYRPPMREEAALDLMASRVGVQFDPEVFACFVELRDEVCRIQRELTADAAPAVS
jgi:cyclic di-GMP phosphodiesterase